MPLSPQLPLSVDALLSRLGYPRPATATGLATWALEEPARPGTRRTHAWVRWDGRELSARLTDTVPGQDEQVLEMAWDVSPAGAAQPRGASDTAGPMDPARAVRDFAQATTRLGPVAFAPVDPPARPARARP